MTNAQRDAMLAHIGWGMALTLAFSLWFPLTVAVGATFIIATVKESIESIWGAWDTKQPWDSALDDVAEFGVGVTIAAILLFIRNH